MDIDMDIKELEAFVYVVENCSFSRAAELLHLTQPTISSHVSALERKLNIKLIVRTTKETYPSDAGKLLYKYAKEILQVRENAAIALRNFSQEMKGTISIAASTVPSQYYLPHLLQDFRVRYPDITFNIQMEDSPKVVELVATRSVEIGVFWRLNYTKTIGFMLFLCQLLLNFQGAKAHFNVRSLSQ